MKNKLITFCVLMAVGAAFFALSFVVRGPVLWWLRIIGIVIMLFGVVAMLVRPRQVVKPPEPVDPCYKYTVKRSYMTAPERELFSRLIEAADGRFTVFPQVALVSVVDKVEGGAYRNELFRVADFGLFDPDTLAPRLLVELNDASHRRAERRQRDEKVSCILSRAGLPLLTIDLADMPEVKTLKKKISNALR